MKPTHFNLNIILMIPPVIYNIYPINRFNTATFVCLSQTRTWISNVICRSLFYVQWVEASGDCLFCWYWSRNYWPSLFKLYCIKCHRLL